jgi:hypothetical protein
MGQLENKMNQSRKEYTEERVPQLIREGKTPNQAIAEANAMWELQVAKAREAQLEVCTERTIEFSAEIDGAFKNISQEDLVFPERSFSEVFAMLEAEPGKRYEIKIRIEEC